MTKKSKVMSLKDKKQGVSFNEMIGIYAQYVSTGGAPKGIELEDLENFGEQTAKIKHVALLLNALLYKERKLIEAIIDDLAVHSIVVKDKLGVSEEDFEDAKETRKRDLENFQKELEAQIAKANIEKAIEKDKEIKGAKHK